MGTIILSLNTGTKINLTLGCNCFIHTLTQIDLYQEMHMDIMQLIFKLIFMMVRLIILVASLEILSNMHYLMGSRSMKIGALQLECSALELDNGIQKEFLDFAKVNPEWGFLPELIIMNYPVILSVLKTFATILKY